MPTKVSNENQRHFQFVKATLLTDWVMMKWNNVVHKLELDVQTQTNQTSSMTSSGNSGKLYIDSQLKDISVGQKCASMTLLFLKVICVLVFVRHCLAKKNGENDSSIPCEGLLKVWLRGGRFYR